MTSFFPFSLRVCICVHGVCVCVCVCVCGVNYTQSLKIFVPIKTSPTTIYIFSNLTDFSIT